MNICLVCVRSGSLGVPNKHLLKMDGITLLERAINQAKYSQIFDVIIFSSNDRTYLNIVERLGGIFIVERQEKLSASDSSKWDVFKDAIKQYELVNGTVIGDDDLIVDLDVSVPFRIMTDIIEAVDSYENGVLITSFESERNPYFNMIEEIKSTGQFKIVCNNLGTIKNRQEAKKVYSLSSSVFVFTKKVLANINHWSEANISTHVIPRKRGFDLDTKEDLELFNLYQNE